MSYHYSKTHIDDIESTNCTEHEINILCDIFCSLMKKLSALHAFSASFNLDNNSWARQLHIIGFSLHIQHALPDCNFVWQGTFTHPNKQAIIIGSIEKL